MSYIPNCREKYAKDVYANYFNLNKDIPDGEINAYWDGNLKGEDKAFINGFDYCVDDAINNLFNNLDVFESEFEEVGIDVNEIDSDIVNGDMECKWYPYYAEEELEKMNSSTRIMLLIKYVLNLNTETNRNMLVTSMIEGMEV